MCSRFYWIAPALLVLGGCASTAHTHIGDEDPAFGESVKYNAAIQTINPMPVYTAANAQPGALGDKGAAAVKRYRTDQVNARHDSQSSSLSTTTMSTGSR